MYQFGSTSGRLHTSPSRQDTDSRPRFQRNSPHSNKNSPNRSVELSPINQKFIKFTKISKARLDPDTFFKGFSASLVKTQQNEQLSASKISKSRQNSLVKLKNLQRELSERQIQFQDMRQENRRLKVALQKEIEKRKIAEKTLKSNIVIISQLQRKIRQYQVTALNQSKQIKFLQEKKYSKEDRLMFSFREKGLLQEIKRIKGMSASNGAFQFLSEEIYRLADQNEQIREENRHLRIAQRTIVNRLLHFQKQLKLAVRLEEEFFELRSKYEQLSKRQRIARKQLQIVKAKYMRDEQTEGNSLTYSSSSNPSLYRGLVKATNSHRSHTSSRKKPNAS